MESSLPLWLARPSMSSTHLLPKTVKTPKPSPLVPHIMDSEE